MLNVNMMLIGTGNVRRCGPGELDREDAQRRHAGIGQGRYEEFHPVPNEYLGYNQEREYREELDNPGLPGIWPLKWHI